MKNKRFDVYLFEAQIERKEKRGEKLNEGKNDFYL